MKKNLLSLAMLIFGISAYSQDTYIKDDVIVKVNPNTLFFHGGNVNVVTSNTNYTDRIINEGNIHIKGDFTNAGSGENFVNKYIDGTSYGQLIIETTNKSNFPEAGKLTVERSSPKMPNNFYAIGFPFTGDIKDIFTSIDPSIQYHGSNTQSDRYQQSALLWDVPTSTYVDIGEDPYKPGENYTFNLTRFSGNQFAQYLATKQAEGDIIKATGGANYRPFSFNKISGIRNTLQEEFKKVDYTWNDWKDLTNIYGETYNSYLGATKINTNSLPIFGKNQHRFANPFTSNIDLSDITLANTWIKINDGAGNYLSPTAAYSEIARFTVNKLPNDFVINWSQQYGGSNTSATASNRVSAYLQSCGSSCTDPSLPFFWVGNPEALIIKPYEYFDINFYTLNPETNLGTLMDVKYEINDKQKTFKTDFTSNNGNGAGFYPASATRGIQKTKLIEQITNSTELKNKSFVAPNDFNQLNIYLINENKSLEDETIFLANGSFYETNNSKETTADIENKIFLYEEVNNGEINRNYKTTYNSFKNDFIGKPLALGLENLEEGKEYKIRFKLFRASILNQVDDFENGIYYLYDKETKKASTINGNSEISFTTKSKNLTDRFVFYWNELPKELATNENLTSKNGTYIYDNQSNKYLRFEKNNTIATVKIHDLTGRLISTFENVGTNSDLDLKLIKIPAVYIVNITYDDGTTVSKKVIQH